MPAHWLSFWGRAFCSATRAARIPITSCGPPYAGEDVTQISEVRPAGQIVNDLTP